MNTVMEIVIMPSITLRTNSQPNRLKLATILALLLLAFSQASQANSPKVEVCFVLDTTGSMSNLIEAAKKKIWYVAKEIVKAEPQPDVHFCLMGYRDRSDDYVTRHFDLTTDLDQIYAELQKFDANGGGDTPESVNQALAEAINKTSWSTSEDVLKTIFLVGDAPPHMDYDELQYLQSVPAAAKRGIIVHALQAGSDNATRKIWQEIAKLGGGHYAAIPAAKNRAAPKTPMDQDISALNKKLGQTLMPYGKKAQQEAVLAKQGKAEEAGVAAMSDRLSYNARTAKAVQGQGDLIQDIADGKAKLSDIAEADLPPQLKRLPAEQRQAKIDALAEERKALQAASKKTIRLRQQWLTSKAGKHGPDSFEAKISELLREMGAKYSLRWP